MKKAKQTGIGIVVPLTLGIETVGGILTPLIQRNTTIPTEKKQIFSTAADNQSAVTIAIFQGERPMAKDNKKIGSFELTDITLEAQGKPQIEVCFGIDANRILHVSAKDKQSGKEQTILITATLTEGELQRINKDAELNIAEDKVLKESIEARNKGATPLLQDQRVVRQ